MLGLLAAVWAVIPVNSKLGFRLSLRWFERIFIAAMLVVIHLVVFESLLLYFAGFPITPAWWPLDKNTTLYLLCLVLALFVYGRNSGSKITKWNIGVFDELTTSLLHAGKFDELSELLQRYLESVLDLASSDGVRSRLAAAIRSSRGDFHITFEDDGRVTLGRNDPVRWYSRQLFSIRDWLADVIGPSERAKRRARIVAHRLLSSRKLTARLAISQPYLCLRIMERAIQVFDGFQDNFFEELLANDSSILYSEVMGNDNFAGGQGRRLRLPEENRLIRFYCADVAVAGKFGVYKSIGEAVFRRIDEDDSFVRRLNGRLLTFVETSKKHDPVYIGVYFFRIMVFEGLHQRSNDHLWLHYMPLFAGRLVDRARAVRPGDEVEEFPTPLAYLLYEITSTTCDWIREAENLVEPGDVVSRDGDVGPCIYICFEASEAIGRVLKHVLMSEKFTDRFKTMMLCTVLHAYRDISRCSHLWLLSLSLQRYVISPYEFFRDDEYLSLLMYYYRSQDHVLTSETKKFGDAIDAALTQKSD
jgi:hypothetical protein